MDAMIFTLDKPYFSSLLLLPSGRKMKKEKEKKSKSYKNKYVLSSFMLIYSINYLSGSCLPHGARNPNDGNLSNADITSLVKRCKSLSLHGIHMNSWLNESHRMIIKDVRGG